MPRSRNFLKRLANVENDEIFLDIIEDIVIIVSKILSVALVIVILVAILDLIVVMVSSLLTSPFGFFNLSLLEIFGFFLNILIALELLENITAYLRRHIFQVELVIATALIAVSRKIIIFDLKTFSSNDLMALGVAIFALSLSYWLVRRINPK